MSQPEGRASPKTQGWATERSISQHTRCDKRVRGSRKAAAVVDRHAQGDHEPGCKHFGSSDFGSRCGSMNSARAVAGDAARDEGSTATSQPDSVSPWRTAAPPRFSARPKRSAGTRFRHSWASTSRPRRSSSTPAHPCSAPSVRRLRWADVSRDDGARAGLSASTVVPVQTSAPMGSYFSERDCGSLRMRTSSGTPIVGVLSVFGLHRVSRRTS